MFFLLGRAKVRRVLSCPSKNLSGEQEPPQLLSSFFSPANTQSLQLDDRVLGSIAELHANVPLRPSALVNKINRLDSIQPGPEMLLFSHDIVMIPAF